MSEGARGGSEGRLWWKHGVLYQIYPRSFADANGDGVGDLEGIRQHLDHLAWLGVDGVWISPCFKSPMADFGYDVADYCDIDPLFGTLADLDRLVEDAHARGLKVMLDWVPNHTSDQHAWFLESQKGRGSPKRDWYVWRDPAPDGGPPNNWISVFGGSAWEYDEASGQYYLHSYLKEQPDLNWRNPAVEEAMHGVLRFWLDRGVDGFRIDVIHRIAKHPELLDNPPSAEGGEGWDGQRHVHDENHPDVHRFLRGIRGVLDEYDEAALVGEVWIFDPDVVGAYYGQGDELHLAFNFAFLDTGWSSAGFKEQIAHALRAIPDVGWPTWVLSNHDISRAGTRYKKEPDVDDERQKLALMLLLTLRGTPWVYYGEELGMRDVPVPEEQWQDPVGATLGPAHNRDPERTPMRWTGGLKAGFTSGEPWLPLGDDVPERNVEKLRDEPGSILRLTRELIALRRQTPALERGQLTLKEAAPGLLLYEREHDGERALVALHLSRTKEGGGDPVEVDLGDEPIDAGVSTSGAELPEAGGRVTLGPDQGLVVVRRARP